MSTATVSHISSSYMSESTHLFYSSDGSTAQPLWGASPAADLSGLFLDPANISWPETDGTDYSPGGYSDSDHQTGFSSGLSSKSSPDDYKDLEPSYLPYGPEWYQDHRYTAGLSPSSEFFDHPEPDSAFGGSTQNHLSHNSAYRNVHPTESHPEQCVNLSQLVSPSRSRGVTQSLSIETVAPRRSAKSRSSSFSNGHQKEESEDAEEDELSYPSSSEYCPSPSPNTENTESKQSIRHHPYRTLNRPKEVARFRGPTTFRTISPRNHNSSERPCAPIPVPIPNLTKKSRGRKVPTVHDHDREFDSAVDDHVPSARTHDSSDGGKVKKVRGGGGAIGVKGGRAYKCTVEDCGKCFIRGEHLKRHIRSIHTYEKPHPCPHEGCDRSFSRRDNLSQHQRVHGM